MGPACSLEVGYGGLSLSPRGGVQGPSLFPGGGVQRGPVCPLKVGYGGLSLSPGGGVWGTQPVPWWWALGSQPVLLPTAGRGLRAAHSLYCPSLSHGNFVGLEGQEMVPFGS